MVGMLSLALDELREREGLFWMFLISLRGRLMLLLLRAVDWRSFARGVPTRLSMIVGI